MRRFSIALATGLAVLLTLAGCGSSGPSIRVDGDPAANIPSFRTFGYFDQLATDKAGYSTILTARLKDATRRELEKHGYQYVDANPELLVNFNVNIAEKTEIRSSPSTSVGYGYYGYRAGMYGAWGGYPQDIETRNYKQGTLSIDVVDASKRALVWQGVAEGRVSKEAQQNPGPAIDAVVAQIMAGFPSRGFVPAQPAAQ
jgi:hypothetical protein